VRKIDYDAFDTCCESCDWRQGHKLDCGQGQRQNVPEICERRSIDCCCCSIASEFESSAKDVDDVDSDEEEDEEDEEDEEEEGGDDGEDADRLL
jgi:hypothetical protein